MVTTHPRHASRGRLAARTLTAVALAATTALAACGSDSSSDSSSSSGSSSSSSSNATLIKKDAANSGKTITLGSKNFTEQLVLGEVYAQALEAAGYTVKRQFNLGDENAALKSVKEKQIDAYPEYTGTILGSFFKVASNAIPKDPTQAYDEGKEKLAAEGITALPPTPFTSSNEVGVTQATAKKYNLTNISDLSKVASQLTIYGSPECRSRLDCLKGLQDVYGLKFKKFVPVDISLRHTVLENGKADVSIVFTTDPQNTRDNVVLLKDDKGMFPPYNSTLLVRTDAITADGPDFAKTIAAVNTNLNAKVVQELNAKVDLDKQTPAAAATSYLQDFGYVAK
ncbi:MAG: glycine betaine ABC transporter substrate-binding protein [Solirubrobacteraceae bacterium]|nr:glycine betaine ABC transporter substrate-binding protein [Patulibacter sp.]